MSRFYASIEGNRGMATRQGTKSSGIQGHIRGWNVGGRIVCDVNDDDEDVVRLYLTGGSRGHKSDKLIGEFKEQDL